MRSELEIPKHNPGELQLRKTNIPIKVVNLYKAIDKA
jgi:hypothetical protein